VENRAAQQELRGVVLMDWQISEHEQVLRDLIARNRGDIEGAAIATTDGVLIASVLPDPIDTERATFLATAAACGVGLAVNLVSGLGNAPLEQLYVKASNGYVILLPVPNEKVLVVLCKPQAKLGLIFLDVSKGGFVPPEPALDPIYPPLPPGSLRAGAKPEYDEID
jgi:uncharacterized protein